jgi:hypothetical protein
MSVLPLAVYVHLDRGPLGNSSVRERLVYAGDMCRNIRQLHNFEPPASEEEVNDAALQFVRKVSGSNKPSKANAEAFDLAVAEVTASTRKLLDSLVTNASPKNREKEAAKRRAKYEERFAA